MAYIVLDIKEGSTKTCEECPFWVGSYENDGSNCGLPTNFPFCEDVDYANMKIIFKDNLNLE